MVELHLYTNIKIAFFDFNGCSKTVLAADLVTGLAINLVALLAIGFITDLAADLNKGKSKGSIQRPTEVWGCLNLKRLP